MMKITKRQLRRIIKEEKARLLQEQPIAPEQAAEMQAQKDLPYVLGYVTDAVYDALEELGFDEGTSEAIRGKLITGALAVAAGDGVDNYVKKLRLSGGKPKPRSI